MSYASSLVDEGEQVIIDDRPHWWYFAKQVLVGVVLLVLFVVIVAETSKTPEKVGLLAWTALFVVFALWLCVRFLQWRSTEFVLTDRRVLFRIGVVSKNGVEIPLDSISNINFHQGPFERVIGAGDLEIESAGRDSKTSFTDVRRPRRLQNLIHEAKEQYRNGANRGAAIPAASASASGSASVPEQIEQLARLRDQGVLTPAEFEAKKTDLLRRM